MNHLHEILWPGDRLLSKQCHALPPVRFRPPFLDCHETPVRLVSGKKRLVFVRHFLVEFRSAIARHLRQKISDRSRSLVIFCYATSFSTAAADRLLRRGLRARQVAFPVRPSFRRLRFGFPAIWHCFLRRYCSSQFCSPFHRQNLRLARSRLASRTRTPLLRRASQSPGITPGRRLAQANGRDTHLPVCPIPKPSYFFGSFISRLDCSNPLSLSPTICCSRYSATTSPLGTLSDLSVCRRRTSYRATSRSVDSTCYASYELP
jgi:hypothetical protein